MERYVVTFQVLMTALTALTALFAAYIAWRQHQLGQRQFRAELYDRRLRVFHAAQSFLSDVARKGSTSFNRCIEFYADAAEVDFLFDDEIKELIEKLYSTGIELAQLHEELYPEGGEPGLPRGDERSRVVRKKSETLKQMLRTLGTLKDAFRPHLNVA